MKSLTYQSFDIAYPNNCEVIEAVPIVVHIYSNSTVRGIHSETLIVLLVLPRNMIMCVEHQVML